MQTGTRQFFGKVVRCNNPACAFPVFQQIAGKNMMDQDLLELLTTGKTRVIKGFNSKQGKAFNTVVAFDEEFHSKFIFSDLKTNDKNKKKKRIMVIFATEFTIMNPSYCKVDTDLLRILMVTIREGSRSAFRI